MHPRAFDYATSALVAFSRETGKSAELRVVEFGASDHDGYNLRACVPGAEWTAVDIAPGPGVDVVCDAVTWGAERSADVVVATELLEHAPDCPGIVANAARLLVPGGVFVATMAGPERGPHGARGEPEPPPGEYYRNVESYYLATWLADANFGAVTIDLTDDHLDLRCVARAR